MEMMWSSSGSHRGGKPASAVMKYIEAGDFERAWRGLQRARGASHNMAQLAVRLPAS